MTEPPATTPHPEPAPWLERVRTGCLVAVAVCVVGATLAYLKTILTPLFIALFLYFLVKPAAEALARWRLSPWVTYPLLAVAVTLLILALGQLVQLNAQAFARRLPDYEERLEHALDWFARLTGHANDEGRFDWQQYTLGDLFKLSREKTVELLVGTTLELLEIALMVLFYLFFIFLEAEKLPRRIQHGFTAEAAAKWQQIGQNIYDGIQKYLTFKTAVSLGLAATTAAVCWAFGVDFWILWAVATFLANYITYVGSIVALAPPIAVAFLQFKSPAAAAALAAILILNRFWWIDYVEIRYSGRQLNISPLLILLAIALFGSLWGVVGMILAVPVMTVAKIVLANFEQTRHYAVLISEE